MSKQSECQLQSIPSFSQGLITLSTLPPAKRVKLWLKRRINGHRKRLLKRTLVALASYAARLKENPATQSYELVNTVKELSPGDWVRIRSREEIESTLNMFKELHNCAMMPDMWQYCETVQQVLKPVERFVDERDYRLKRARGLVLLKDLICQGTPDYGRCDRACFYFWHVEWLEKVERSHDE